MAGKILGMKEFQVVPHLAQSFGCMIEDEFWVVSKRKSWLNKETAS
jgi:hypothetical protein